MIYQLDELVPNVHPTAWVADSAAVIGNVELAENVSVWFGAVLRSDGARITIDAGTNIQDNAVMHGGIVIGKDCVIAHLSPIHACKMGDGVLIGNGALVFDRVEAGDGAFIAAGAVVVPGTLVPPNTLMLGAPARGERSPRVSGAWRPASPPAISEASTVPHGPQKGSVRRGPTPCVAPWRFGSAIATMAPSTRHKGAGR